MSGLKHILFLFALATLVPITSTAKKRPQPSTAAAAATEERESIVSPEYKASSQLSDFNVSAARAANHPLFVGLKVQIDRPQALTTQYRFATVRAEDGWGLGDMSPPQETPLWRDACTGTCDSWLYRNAAYKVVGSWITDEKFYFPRLGKSFVLHVRPQSRALRVFAWVSLLAGAASTVLAVGTLAATVLNPNNPNQPIARDITIASHLIGIPLMLASIPMFKFSRTQLELERVD